MTYLTRGPGGTPGIGSKGHPSGEPTPFRAQIANAMGGDSMSLVPISTASSHSTTTPQATP
jgi:hypothetical protein